MDIRGERDQAVAEAVGRVRDIEHKDGVNPDALEAIKEVLLELAGRRKLFPLDDFPIGPEDGTTVIYRLSEDPDHRFALYAMTALPGKGVQPHNHTTWAVIVGIDGDEHNIFYERTDDGSVEGRGELRQTGEFTITSGTGMAMMPDDIHSIHVTGDEKTVHLHMYGLALEQLHERMMYDTQAGTYKIFPASQNIKPI